MDVAMTIPLFDLLMNISLGLIGFAILMSITLVLTGRQDQKEAADAKEAAAFERKYIDQPLEQAAQVCGNNPEEKARVFFRAVDRVMTHLPPVCRHKCGRCCYQAIDIYPLERPALEVHIQKLPDERKAYVRQHAKAWIKQYNRVYDRQLKVLSDDDSDNIISSDRSGNRSEVAGNLHNWIIDEFSKTPVMCPFLYERSCLIYPVRPVMCRDYVMNASPVRCEEQSVEGHAYQARHISHQTQKHLKQSGPAEPLLYALSDVLSLDVTMNGMGKILNPDFKAPLDS